MKQKHSIIIVDIDGTISKVGGRLVYLQTSPPDWDAFYDACFEDEPHMDIINIVKTFMRSGNPIVFCTGRRESVRQKTEEWLGKHGFENVKLLMRPDGDFRHDIEIKPEQIKLAGIELDDIAFVLEDRNSMVAKWRELGVRCLQVAEGDF